MHILMISGSLRKGSYNTALLAYATTQIPAGATHEMADIASLPLINPDLEQNLPASVKALKEAIAKADAIIIASPEYNYSISAPLKNAIDWASRPYGQNSWKGKVVGVMGGSPGGFGTVRMQPHLKYIFSILGCHTLYLPEVQISAVDKKIDAAGNVTDEETQKKIKELVDAVVKAAS